MWYVNNLGRFGGWCCQNMPFIVSFFSAFFIQYIALPHTIFITPLLSTGYCTYLWFSVFNSQRLISQGWGLRFNFQNQRVLLVNLSYEKLFHQNWIFGTRTHHSMLGFINPPPLLHRTPACLNEVKTTSWSLFQLTEGHVGSNRLQNAGADPVYLKCNGWCDHDDAYNSCIRIPI